MRNISDIGNSIYEGSRYTVDDITRLKALREESVCLLNRGTPRSTAHQLARRLDCILLLEFEELGIPKNVQNEILGSYVINESAELLESMYNKDDVRGIHYWVELYDEARRKGNKKLSGSLLRSIDDTIKFLGISPGDQKDIWGNITREEELNEARIAVKDIPEYGHAIAVNFVDMFYLEELYDSAHKFFKNVNQIKPFKEAIPKFRQSIINAKTLEDVCDLTVKFFTDHGVIIHGNAGASQLRKSFMDDLIMFISDPGKAKLFESVESVGYKDSQINENWNPNAVTADYIQMLNGHLATAFVMYSNYKNYHWNINGPNFISLHKELDEFSNSTLSFIDELGERIKILNGVPIYSAVDISRLSAVLPSNELNDPIKMLLELHKNLITITTAMRNASASADAISDVGTSDMFIRTVQSCEKAEYFIRQILISNEIPHNTLNLNRVHESDVD